MPLRSKTSRRVVNRAAHRRICVSAFSKIRMKLVRRFALVSLLTLALLVSGYSTPVARGNDAIANLDAFIAKALKEYQVPGAAVAVVQDGKVVWLKGYGVRDVTKPGAVDENAIFSRSARVGPRIRETNSTVLGMTARKYCDASDFSSRVTACAKWHSIPIQDFLSPVKLRHACQNNRGMISWQSVCSRP